MTWDVLEYHNCDVYSCYKTENTKCNKVKKEENILIFLTALAPINHIFFTDRLQALHQIFQAYHSCLKKLHV